MIIDLHCDTLGMGIAPEAGKVRLRKNDLHLDLERLKALGTPLQCFAVYVSAACDMPKRFSDVTAMEFFDISNGYFMRELKENADLASPVYSFSDILKNRAQDKVSCMLTVEDGALVDGNFDNLNYLYERGVRMLTLTWNYENCFGFPNGSDGGLKDFGKEAVMKMQETGIIADVSHLSDAGFLDVARLCKKPFVASHSNARALCGHKRNLTDEMLKALADAGGVTGLNFCTAFLNEKAKQTSINDILRHADYIIKKAGVDTLALGSDFDGIENRMEFKDSSGWSDIIFALEKRFGSRSAEKICSLNALRVFKDCL